MKKVLHFLLFILLAATGSAENAVAPTPSPGSPLSFSVIPAYTMPIGPDGSLGAGIAGSQWFAPGWSLAISCQYTLPSSPLYIGADLGYSWVPYGDWKSLGLDPYQAWPSYSNLPKDDFVRMSIWQAGLIAGLHVSILPTLDARGFGSAGYSYNILSNGAGRGATPFVCVGAELSWAFLPALSLTAGAKYRRFFDLYADVAFTRSELTPSRSGSRVAAWSRPIPRPCRRSRRAPAGPSSCSRRSARPGTR